MLAPFLSTGGGGFSFSDAGPTTSQTGAVSVGGVTLGPKSTFPGGTAGAVVAVALIAFLAYAVSKKKKSG